ncbi:MAG: response regulator transcription factor [Sideroxydans sp.]|nr:response regulator transcription factor [Sideroxydans sp.]
MNRHIFITNSGFPPERWKEAFPSSHIVSADSLKDSASAKLFWIHLPGESMLSSYLPDVISRLSHERFVVLSDQPNDEQGLEVLSLGASGYCNAYADAEVLAQVAEVVLKDGLWVGRSLLNRFIVSVNTRMQSVVKADPNLNTFGLTEREHEVALRVARGEPNKTIANDLNISDRTVKAHLTMAFKKLNVRDRLQLALLINRGQ